MAEALLGIVAENLQSFAREELATFWGVDSQIQKLSSNLTAIRAVLQDAEEQQITSQAVKDWLQKLSDAAYVLDDILDECSIQFSNHLQYEEGNSGVAHKVHSLCLTRFSPKTILFRYEIGKRMKEVVKRFQDIDEERKTFELRTGVIERQQEDDKWRQTCSAITVEQQIYGRDQDKERIVEFLLSNHSESGDFSVYPIVGMGGLGKTTLARWVFNDDRVIKHFDLKIWVCVSDNFDVMRILQAIAESTMGQNPNLSTLESMQKKVQEVLFGKRYLLVLDDVWNDDDHQKWENLKSVLHCGGGTKAASVLVTTRLDGVASIMGTCQTHHLLPLPEGDNLSLFKYHAFGPNKEGRAELVAIGEKIVRKCAGSPLASKALGSLLRNKNEEKQWLDIKESKFWDIPQGDAIMRALRISYFNLKLPLRCCFSFCAIYPEDFEISKEQLIHLWMANGLIKSRGNMEVEDVGNEAWEELCQRSFFQEINTDFFGNITFKIHDLLHEFAQSIMGEECKVSKSKSIDKLSNRVHHISCSDINESFRLDMDAIRKFESLRTFVELCPVGNFYELKAFNFVRALRTSSYWLSPLRSLTHLRYLNISRNYITTLPEGISRLQKLQILKLEDCPHVSCLPKNLTQLKDLRHLLIEECPSLAEMPPNIGAMKCLKTLGVFIVDSKTGCGLAELHDLQLGGKLHIKGLENVLSESDARSANLISKKDLNRLYLSWDYNSKSECTADAEPERILEALEPHPNLKSFGMKGYRGTQFPGWMIKTSFLSGLARVILFDCKNCEQLPPLGKLPHLAILSVSGMSNVKYMDDDSYDGMVEEKAFKSLKKLTLSRLPNLERMLRDERVEMLPHLSSLRVSCVPKLRLPLLQSVERLRIEGPILDSNHDGNEDMASFPKALVQSMPHVKFLTIQGLPKLKVLPDEVGSLSSLQELEICDCHELESFSESVLQGLNSLQTLMICDCEKLKSLSEGVGHLTCLKRLEIVRCPELVTLPNNMNQLTALRRVRINSDLTIPEGLQRIPSLQRLRIAESKVDSLPEWLGHMASLQQLDISDCPKLRSLPSSFQHLTNLRKLHIEDCPKLEKRCKRGTGEDWQNIAHIQQREISSEPKLTFCEKIQLRWDARKIKPRDDEFDEMVDWL